MGPEGGQLDTRLTSGDIMSLLHRLFSHTARITETPRSQPSALIVCNATPTCGTTKRSQGKRVSLISSGKLRQLALMDKSPNYYDPPLHRSDTDSLLTTVISIDSVDGIDIV